MADKRLVRLNHGPDRVYFDDIYHETRCNLELLKPEAQRANTASSHLQKLNSSEYTDVSSGHRCFVIFLNDGPGKTINITPGRCKCTTSSQRHEVALRVYREGEGSRRKEKKRSWGMLLNMMYI